MDDAQNLEERILKLRKSARPSGPKAVKANFFTASEGLQGSSVVSWIRVNSSRGHRRRSEGKRGLFEFLQKDNAVHPSKTCRNGKSDPDILFSVKLSAQKAGFREM